MVNAVSVRVAAARVSETSKIVPNNFPTPRLGLAAVGPSGFNAVTHSPAKLVIIHKRKLTVQS